MTKQQSSSKLINTISRSSKDLNLIRTPMKNKTMRPKKESFGMSGSTSNCDFQLDMDRKTIETEKKLRVSTIQIQSRKASSKYKTTTKKCKKISSLKSTISSRNNKAQSMAPENSASSVLQEKHRFLATTVNLKESDTLTEKILDEESTLLRIKPQRLNQIKPANKASVAIQQKSMQSTPCDITLEAKATPLKNTDLRVEDSSSSDHNDTKVAINEQKPLAKLKGSQWRSVPDLDLARYVRFFPPAVKSDENDALSKQSLLSSLISSPCKYDIPQRLLYVSFSEAGSKSPKQLSSHSQHSYGELIEFNAAALASQWTGNTYSEANVGQHLENNPVSTDCSKRIPESRALK